MKASHQAGPTPEVLAAFGLSGKARVLTGGMEPAYLVGEVVLKRADLNEEVVWKSELLAGLPEVGFRLARPVRAVDGSWTAGGWMASCYVEGHHAPVRWVELFAAARAFHIALAQEPRPSFLDLVQHRWARAHRAVWGEAELEPLQEVAQCERLRELSGPSGGRAQLVHGDVAGNVLFADGSAPALLDFSPWWAPVSYAEGILVADALLYHGADSRILGLVSDPAAYPGMLARGALFRLLTLNEGVKEGHPEYLDEIAKYDELITLIESWT